MRSENAARPIRCTIQFYRHIGVEDIDVWLPAVPRPGEEIIFGRKAIRRDADCGFYVRSVSYVAVVASRPSARPVRIVVSDSPGAQS